MTDIPGVDVASFQGIPRDWQAAAGSSIDWAAVKFTELGADGSRYVNPDAAADWAWLGAHGIKRVAYMYGHPAAGPHESVAFFVGQVLAAGLRDDDMIALDSEASDGRAPAEVAAWGLEVLQLIHHDTGRRPIEYIDLSYAEAGNAAGHGEYPLWITDPSSPAGHPRVPAPWTAWHLHQYSITSPIDRDVARYPDGAAMAAALGKPKPPKPPAPRLGKDDPMLLNPGHNAVTPIAIPKGTEALRFLAAEDAHISVEFHGQAEVRDTTLSWAAGSLRAIPPKDCHAALVTRLDRGNGGVSVAVE